MSLDFSITHDFEVRPLQGLLTVQTPGGSLEAVNFVPSCPIRLGRLSCPWDLVVIPLKEYGVVLGMD